MAQISLFPFLPQHTICKFAPQFAGNAQQDAQELLAFLMDGLHEDLNRIKLREVSEPRDFSGMADTQIAKLSWEDHKKRNDSLVVDWFQGQFRSTVVCLRCKYRSVTFEAFMYLSLPIPPGSRPYTLKVGEVTLASSRLTLHLVIDTLGGKKD